MSIVFNNAIRNAGKMPKIQATSDINSIVGQLNSIALDTSSNLLYYWDLSTPEWVALSGSGALNLQSVLSTGNTASDIGPVITGANYEVNEASFFARDSNLSRAIVVNADGIQFGDYDLIFKYFILSLIGGDPVLSFFNTLGGVTELSSGATADSIAVSLPKTSGNLYCIDIFEVTLVNGVVTFSPGGQSNLILGIGIKSPIGTLGVNYKWAGVGGSGAITITSLKTNGTTEASDLSVLYVTIAL